jgi:endonuclease YncB( thermonuclease family)
LRRLALIGLLLIGACGGADARDAAGEPSFAARARALDGDTVATDFRLLGVDAFERRQLCERDGACWACGKAAQDSAAHFLGRGDASIRLSRGASYGRPVATVSVGGADLGEWMIRQGLAIPQPQFLGKDRVRAQLYDRAFAEAKRSRAGALAGKWIEPAQWRRGRRLACEN